MIRAMPEKKRFFFVDPFPKDEVQLAINKIQADFNTNTRSYSEEERILFMKIDHNYNYHIEVEDYCRKCHIWRLRPGGCP